MKKNIALFFLIILYGCNKDCVNVSMSEISEDIKIYFDCYNLKDSMIFKSRNRFDTIRIIKIMLDTATTRNLRNCEIANDKKIYFRSKYFYSTNPICMTLSTGYFVNLYTYDNQLLKKDSFLFDVNYNNNDKTFFMLDPATKNTVSKLDKFSVNNQLYERVLKIDVVSGYYPKTTVFFAPKKGLIRWENKIDTFNIQN